MGIAENEEHFYDDFTYVGSSEKMNDVVAEMIDLFFRDCLDWWYDDIAKDGQLKGQCRFYLSCMTKNIEGRIKQA